ncbi:hypothetical protein PVV74_15295 [Roseovarius sp. SK2]|uniref:anti-sigma factor family protein n=1 Tax=Roseovarius TaxID=74030 RepID=UPI00237A610A|nr:hypothetical protein [Roseovarius sp. SK2]MDD9726825.1 hypothetical protein [Roseovarius sp. SK2]
MSTPDKVEVSDEMLMALADGELDGATAEDLSQRIEQDPDLAARYALFAETATSLRAAFAQGAVPEHLVETVRETPTDDGQTQDRPVSAVVPLRHRRAWPLALAASLVIGVGVGWTLQERFAQSGAAPLEDVAAALSDVPTGQTRDVGGVGPARALGSYETQQGLCRLISVQPAGTMPRRFLACRNASEWAVVVSVADGSRDGFSPANDAATEMLDLYLDTIGAGPALDASSEAKALK